MNGFAAAGEACRDLLPPGAHAAVNSNHAWFCTAENKRYDLVVTAILTAALHRPGILLSEVQWKNRTAGIAIYDKAIQPLAPDQRIAVELDI